MQRKSFQGILAALIVAVSFVLSGCGGGASADGATGGAPSGAYESQMPGGTAMRLSFGDGGAVEIAMTEDGQTNAFDGQWVQNGETILVEGGEGMTMQMSWQGDALVTDFGGAVLTFNKN